MSKTEVVFMACFLVLGFTMLGAEWGTSAEMILLVAFLAGAMFEMVGENLPTPPYWNLIGRGALRTWGFIAICILVIIFLGVVVKDRGAVSDLVKGALGVGGKLPAFALAGIAFCLGLLCMTARVPGKVLNFVRKKWWLRPRH